jgi:AmmeMemoRadiSam system protein B
MSSSQCSASETAHASLRRAAVAGQFYPSDPLELRRVVAGYIAAGKPLEARAPIIISPHAGYVFSGPVAGIGFAATDPSATTVILIGPAHRKAFQGVSFSDVDGYETPLGTVPVNRALLDKIRANPAAKYDPEADGPEHCLEVQVPFLQVRLREFTLVALLCGNVDPAVVADMVFPLIDAKTLVVISSDFSHYRPHSQAKKLDSASIRSILSGTGEIDACGEIPIRVAMLLAKKMGLQPRLLDARNSSETAPEYKSANQVVGYASIVYLKSGDPLPHSSDPFSDEDKKTLLNLARESLNAAVRGEKPPRPGQYPAPAAEKCGCFVTLTIAGELRGCIGTLEGAKPLFQGIIDNARNAALNDPRFPAVVPAELSSIRIEVSVLTPPEPLTYANPEELFLPKDICKRPFCRRYGISFPKRWNSWNT